MPTGGCNKGHKPLPFQLRDNTVFLNIFSDHFNLTKISDAIKRENVIQMTVGSCSQLSRLIYVWKSNTSHILNVQVEEKQVMQ